MTQICRYLGLFETKNFNLSIGKARNFRASICPNSGRKDKKSYNFEGCAFFIRTWFECPFFRPSSVRFRDNLISIMWGGGGAIIENKKKHLLILIFCATRRLHSQLGRRTLGSRGVWSRSFLAISLRTHGQEGDPWTNNNCKMGYEVIV